MRLAAVAGWQSGLRLGRAQSAWPQISPTLLTKVDEMIQYSGMCHFSLAVRL
jgi:hypothetical protein